MIDFIKPIKAMNLHWYVQIKNRESGPYSFLEILSMVHNTDLSADDLITYRGLGDWHPVKNFANLSPEEVNKILEENDIDPEDGSEVPFRRSIRIPTFSEAIVVIDDILFKCKCIDLSTGGCLLKVPKGKIKVESEIKIHFYKDSKINLMSFNAKGEVMRVISATKIKEDTSAYDLLGVKFELKKTAKQNLKAKLREIIFTTLSDDNIEQVLNRGKALSA